MAADDESELSSLEDESLSSRDDGDGDGDGDGDAGRGEQRAEEREESSPASTQLTTGPFNRPQRIRQLLNDCSRDTRPLNRIRMLKSVARHLASCSVSELESARWMNDVIGTLISCYDAAPKRHRPLFVIPAQDVLFTLQQLRRSGHLEPSLKARLATLVAPAPRDQPLPTAGLSADMLSKRRLTRTRYFEAEEMHVELDVHPQPPPMNAVSKSALLAHSGAAYSLSELVTKISQGDAISPNSLPESQTLLAEALWFERAPLPVDMSRLRRLIQLINMLGSRIWGPRIRSVVLPPNKSPISGPKRRKVEILSASNSRHAGTVNTIWENLQIRRHLRIEQVESLFLLREALKKSARAFSAPGSKKVDIHRNPIGLANLASFAALKIRDWNAQSVPKNCSLCGAYLHTSAEKVAHVKIHLLRAAPVVPGLLGHRPDAPPPLLPLPNWIDLRLMESDQKTDVTRLAKTANFLTQCLAIQATDELTRPLADLLAPINLSNLPTDLTLPVQETTHLCGSGKERLCAICGEQFEVTCRRGQWIWENAAMLKTADPAGPDQQTPDGKRSWAVWGCLGGEVSTSTATGLSGRIDSLVAGRPAGMLRRSLGLAYSSARDAKKGGSFCPEALRSVLASIARVCADRDTLATCLRQVANEPGRERIRSELMDVQHFLQQMIDMRSRATAEQQHNLTHPPRPMVTVEDGRSAISRSTNSYRELFQLSLDGMELDKRMVHWTCLRVALRSHSLAS